MIFRQILHDDLGCASYLIGDEHAGSAAVVDPKLDIDEYLDLARYLGVRIEHILETHNHADHVSGHGRLAAATGATIHIWHTVAPDFQHNPIDESWELRLGTVLVRALHTPGHRPEHTVFALVEESRGPEPWAVLSGDSLFVGDIARPDLAVEKEEGARAIFASLHTKLLSLPDTCEVWPGHLGGSLCGGPGMDLKVSSTIGYERAHNVLLQITDVEQFTRASIAKLGPQPPNFHKIVEINHGPLAPDALEPVPLAPGRVQEKLDAGALGIDVRTEPQFDEAHIPRSVSITALRAGFGSKLAWLARSDQEVILIGRDDEDARHATRLADAVAITSIAGYLHGGMTTWREERRPVERTLRMSVAELHTGYSSGAVTQILDVRERSEWEAVHIPGSHHLPYHDLQGIPEGLDREEPIAVICASGQRAAVAASLLQRHGARRVIHVVDGGIPQWERSGWTVGGAAAD